MKHKAYLDYKTARAVALLVALCWLVAFIFPASLCAQSKRAMTFDDILSLRSVSDPRLSPDGRAVAFVVTEADMKTNFRNSDVWVVATEGGSPQPVTRSPKKDDQPQWSPDSRRLAFISDRDGKAQLYVISLEGGEAKKITDSPTPVQSFAWSPDGRRIAFICADPLPEAREKEKKDGFDQIVVDEDFQYAHIHVIEAAFDDHLGRRDLPKPVKLTGGPLHVTALAWSPDGSHIAFAARATPKLADSPTAEIYLIASNASEADQPARLTTNDRSESDLAWSPDAKTLSYLSTSDKYPTIGPSRIHLLSIDGARAAVAVAPRILHSSFDGYINRHAWSRDGKHIYFSADYRVGRHIYRTTPEGGAIEPVTKEEGAQGSFTLSRTGDRIAYLKESAASPADVWTAALSSAASGVEPSARRITRMNPPVEQMELGRAEVVRWKSSKDGREIEGILIYPVGYEKGRRYPLLTSIHGGPEGAYHLTFTASYSEPAHVYAARGYACFFPNFRGSSSYGAQFASLNVGDLGGGDYEDVMSGVDYLIERGIADPERLAVKGFSYGGYLSGWIIGHTDRFKAAVFGAGLSNAISYYSQGDIQYQRETLHQGTPWRNPQNMIERSPVMYLHKARTPSLIFHGEKDQRVPLPQSLETYMGLKKAGAPAQLVIYPREGHGLVEPKHQLDKMRRELEWLEKYVKGEQGSK